MCIPNGTNLGGNNAGNYYGIGLPWCQHFSGTSIGPCDDVKHFMKKMNDQADDYRRISDDLADCWASGCQPKPIPKTTIQQWRGIALDLKSYTTTAYECAEAVKDDNDDAKDKADIAHCARNILGYASPFQGNLKYLNLVYTELWNTYNNLLDYVVETFNLVATVIDCGCSDPVDGGS